MGKTVPTRALEAVTRLPALELEIRARAFLVNGNLAYGGSYSFWDRPALLWTFDGRAVTGPPSGVCSWGNAIRFWYSAGKNGWRGLSWRGRSGAVHG